MVQQTLVFISHTQSMKTHPAGESFVDGAEEAVNSVDGAKAFHMAFFPAADQAPWAYSLRQLEKADVFLAVVGFDPGSPVPGDGRSYTELEFDGATERRRERLVFLLDSESAHLEGVDPQRVSVQQLRFRQRLQTSGATVAFFSDVGDLKYRVRQAVEQSVRERAGRRRTEDNEPSPRPASDRGPASHPRPTGRAVVGVVSVGGGVALVALAAAALAVWTGVSGAFPPWHAQNACDGVTATARAVDVPFPVQKPVGALEVTIRNATAATVHVPSASDVTARGAQGHQYATDSPPGDQGWFFDVSLQPQSTTALLLGVSASSPVTDQVGVVIPGVRGASGPLIRCIVTVPPVDVTIGAGH